MKQVLYRHPEGDQVISFKAQALTLYTASELERINVTAWDGFLTQPGHYRLTEEGRETRT